MRSETEKRRAEMLAAVEQHLGDAAAADLRIKLDDADRVSVIRDAFLEGRDGEAIEVCMTAMDMVVVVTNIGVMPMNFRGAVLGKSLPEPRRSRGVALDEEEEE